MGKVRYLIKRKEEVKKKKKIKIDARTKRRKNVSTGEKWEPGGDYRFLIRYTECLRVQRIPACLVFTSSRGVQPCSITRPKLKSTVYFFC